MEKMKSLYDNTTLTIQEIADELGYPFGRVWQYIANTYTKEERKARKIICYSNSKLGEKNPQFGMVGEKAHQYLGVVSDGKGYLMVLKPDWFTGRKGCKHVFQHHIVMCQALGLTEMPHKMCVHHIDGNKINNELSNLALMTVSAHCRLHQLEGATTRAKARRV